MRNIELKAQLPDRSLALEACLKIAAMPRGDIHQVDTYFRVPHGRLKLRVAHPGVTELVYYHRPDVAGAKGCDYRLEPASAGVGDLLGEALGVLATVDKVRTLYLWENVRIHLDEVTDLGAFIEFEAVQERGVDDQTGYDKLAFLIDVFGIEEQDHLQYSYLDMALNAR